MNQGETILSRFLVALLLAAAAMALLAADAGAWNVYVPNSGSDNLTVIDGKTNQQVGAPIQVGDDPVGIAIAPDGKTAYVSHFDSSDIWVIDTETNQPVGPPIKARDLLSGLAITPDGKTLYVGLWTTERVVAINTQSRQAVGSPIDVGNGPERMAITPDGKSVYVPNLGTKNVSVINTKTNEVSSTIPVGNFPVEVAITPDGKTAYVTNASDDTLSVINVQEEKVVFTIPVGDGPEGIAITPDGRTAYVTDSNAKSVSVINTQTNEATSTIPVSDKPSAIAITPDGKTAYVANIESNNVSLINTQTNQVVGPPTLVGTEPSGIAIVPVDLPPLASFSPPQIVRLRAPVPFDASASHDVDGSLTKFAWDFGDKSKGSPTEGPTLLHSFAHPGTYQVSLTVTDDEGCATAPIFSGQKLLCAGSAQATMTKAVKVVYPGVRVKCPVSARPKGCKFTLQALTKKRKGQIESKVTKAKVKGGKTAFVPLKPTSRFAKKLSTAKEVLVEETLQIGGSTRTTLRRLLIRLAGNA